MNDAVRASASIGRDAEMRELVRILTSTDNRTGNGSAGALVSGELGVGCTWLARDVARRLSADGWTVHRLAASTATQAQPYGAFIHVLAADERRGLDLSDPIAVLAQARDVLTKRPSTLLLADDLHLLDDASRVLLVQLLRAGVVTLLATSRPEYLATSAMQVFDQTVSLHRCDLAAFDVAHTAAFAEQLLGAPLDGLGVTALYEATGGLPLAISEVIRAALVAGSLARYHGLFHVGDTLVSTPTLRRLLLGTTQELSPGALRLLKAIAIAASAPLEPLESDEWLSFLLELDAARWIIDEPDPRRADGSTTRRPRVRVRSAAVRLCLVDEVTAIERRALLRQLTTVVEAAPGGGNDDALDLAAWRVAAGMDADTDLLIAGAREARRLHDFRTAAVLSDLAARATSSTEMVLLHAESLHELGSFTAADELLTEASAHVESDLVRLQLGVARHRVLLWGQQRADESAAVLADVRESLKHPLLRALSTIAEANVRVFDAQPVRAVELLESIDLTIPVIAINAGFPLSIAYMYMGRVVDAHEEAVRTIAAHQAFGGLREALPHPLLDRLALYLSALECGRFQVAYDGLLEGYTVAVRERLPQMYVWFALSAGRAALFQGRIRTAARHFAEARTMCEEILFVSGRRIALNGITVCAATLGDTDLANRTLDELIAAGDDLGVLAAESALAHGAARAAIGDHHGAAEALRAGAAKARLNTEYLFELELLWEAARVGSAAPVVDRVEELALLVQGELTAARVEGTRAIAHGGAEELTMAAERFERCGALLVAAELGERAASVLHAMGQTRLAGRSARHAAELRELCEGAVQPDAKLPSSSNELSVREQEVAALVIEGLSSKEIASTLCVSVRTVSNHLQNAYLKLGVSSRKELVALLTT